MEINLLDIFDSEVALEADGDTIDDITNDVKKETNTIMNRSKDTNTEEDGISDEDMSEEDQEGTEPEDGEENNENGDLGFGEEDQENNMDDSSFQDNEMQEEIDDEDYQRKLALHHHYLKLRQIITSNIELIAQYKENDISDERYKELNAIKNNLHRCSDIISDILVEKFDKCSYVVLMKKYVGLKQAYQVILKMTEEYFSKTKKDDSSLDKNKQHNN